MVAAADGDVGLAAGERERGGVRVAVLRVAVGVAAREDDVQGLERDVEDARGRGGVAQEGEERAEAAELDEALRLACAVNNRQALS